MPTAIAVSLLNELLSCCVGCLKALAYYRSGSCTLTTQSIKRGLSACDSLDAASVGSRIGSKAKFEDALPSDR